MDSPDAMTRRQMMLASATTLAGGASLLGQIADAQEPATQPASGREVSAPGQPERDYTPVFTPNGTTLPWKVVDGVKVFHLIAEPVRHEFAPGLVAECWGYNGRTPGPTIEAVEGDRCRFYVTNHLPAPTTVHWHGIRLPNGMDGVEGLTQPPIPPGHTFVYEFTLRQYGTYMYHPHFDEMTQQGLGMMGMLIIHPRQQRGPKIDRDFVIMLSEWRIDPGTRRPNPNEMTDFNIFTMNSKVFPATYPLVAKLGDHVRIRFGNLSAMDHHPIHLHGYDFAVTETDGGEIPESARYRANTILVPVGSTRAVDLVANEPGDWAMHCHMTHHTMNQMGHGFPNMIGVQTGNADQQVQSILPDYMTMGQTGMGDMSNMGMPMPPNSIPMLAGKGQFGTTGMGGMFTVLKVRPEVQGYEDPGFYRHPPRTVAWAASVEELRRDGIQEASGAAGTQPAVYTCPMHPDVQSDKPGNCPTCGMKLVPKH